MLRIVQQRVPGAGGHRLRIVSLRAFPHRAGVRKDGLVGRGWEKEVS